jgi:hypothetical protein
MGWLIKSPVSSPKYKSVQPSFQNFSQPLQKGLSPTPVPRQAVNAYDKQEKLWMKSLNSVHIEKFTRVCYAAEKDRFVIGLQRHSFSKSAESKTPL